VTGTVFDIQRCSLHDGPGIRTTVFLKGCPLRCLWCHNPESISPQKQLMRDASLCANCAVCAGVEYCPQSALRIAGWETEADAVIGAVQRDMAYFKNSGGGMTLSGGEPAMQPEFSCHLLKDAKKHGIHTCVDTCGFADEETFAAFRQYTDLFLFDYKETNPAKHRELTGVSNEPILRNFAYLYESGADMILRCPLVPGVNDTPEHLNGIAALVKRHPKLLGVEIMPYHRLGLGKAAQIGAAPFHAETPPEGLKRHWLGVLSANSRVHVTMH